MLRDALRHLQASARVIKRDVIEHYKLGPAKREIKSFDDIRQASVVMLITTGRSGTMYLSDYCAKHSDMICEHNPQPPIASLGYQVHQGKITSDASVSAFLAARAEYLKTAYIHERTFFNGECKNLPYVEHLSTELHNAVFLHVVRKPRAFILSGLSRGYYETKIPELWGHLQQNDEANTSEFTERVRRILWFWDEANRIAERMKDRFGPSRVRTIRSKEIFKDPGSVLETIREMVPEIIHNTPSAPFKGRQNQNAQPATFSVAQLEKIDDIISEDSETNGLYF